MLNNGLLQVNLEKSIYQEPSAKLKSHYNEENKFAYGVAVYPTKVFWLKIFSNVLIKRLIVLISFISLEAFTEAASASSSIIKAGTSNSFGVPSTTFAFTSFENQSIKFSRMLLFFLITKTTEFFPIWMFKLLSNLNIYLIIISEFAKINEKECFNHN